MQMCTVGPVVTQLNSQLTEESEERHVLAIDEVHSWHSVTDCTVCRCCLTCVSGRRTAEAGAVAERMEGGMSDLQPGA